MGIEDVIEVSRDARKEAEGEGRMWRMAFVIRLTNQIAGQRVDGQLRFGPRLVLSGLIGVHHRFPS